MSDVFPEYLVKVKNTRFIGKVKFIDYEHKVVKLVLESGHETVRLFDEVELTYRFKEVQKDFYTDLTETEIKVLSLLAQGLSYDEMTKKLVVAPSTIKTHCNSIRQKLHLKGLGTDWKVKAAKIAQQMGLVGSLN